MFNYQRVVTQKHFCSIPHHPLQNLSEAAHPSGGIHDHSIHGGSMGIQWYAMGVFSVKLGLTNTHGDWNHQHWYMNKIFTLSHILLLVVTKSNPSFRWKDFWLHHLAATPCNCSTRYVSALRTLVFSIVSTMGLLGQILMSLLEIQGPSSPENSFQTGIPREFVDSLAPEMGFQILLFWLSLIVLRFHDEYPCNRCKGCAPTKWMHYSLIFEILYFTHMHMASYRFFI